ncbi:DUF2075 domain-containing protein [Waltera intestinalis]|uniref:DUF2075 domain-containing protein n=1 Tax=Waltera intestinalis TaxID=2606635 RepID=A0A6L5YHL1_9FIRM|nr:DUF2075 domain-containing protein [Waltera intestinalis]MST57705.1 DUF2075 domain-containing protein [Waltera intestinalis]
MLIYNGLKSDFMSDTENDVLETKLYDAIKNKMNRSTGLSELNSWRNSLKEMYITLNDSNIPSDAGVAIEYNIPQTSKRVDFLISGYGKDNKGNVIIVELKQWEKLQAIEGQEAIVETFTGGANRRVVHPSYQAWSYAALIKDYNEYVQDADIELHPCAYLHNYPRVENDPLDAKQYKEVLADAPAFTYGQRDALRNFIKKSIITGDNEDTLVKIEHGKIRPSKQLQDSISGMLKGNKEFIMLDEQKVVYENILSLSTKCQKDGKKRTIIVEGGPGTGKTVVAINLLAELTKRNQFVQYVSKNAAPRTVYGYKLKGTMKKSSVDNLFKGSGCYTEAPMNSVGTILADEAHRLNEKSGMFQNMGENQIKEIIHASRCSVFFIDESQRVTTSDIGSIAEIEKWAERENSEVIKMELVSQFRCNGSDGYLAWIDDVLQIRDTANYDLEGIDYDIRICDSPKEMEHIVIEKNRIRNRARILAGYCWNWPKDTRNDVNYHDIKIGDYGISWNLDGGDAFAINPDSVHEAGCIHTSQGLEFDYVGVIIGDDMRYENGEIVTDYSKRAKTDQSMKGIKGLAKDDPEKASQLADEIIKNTYRTLMTRGMKGCYVYCTDSELAAYLKERLKSRG